MNYFEEPSTPLFLNKSKVKFFYDESLELLEKEINAFMITTRKIYNVKHFVALNLESNRDMHYIMVSYE